MGVIERDETVSDVYYIYRTFAPVLLTTAYSSAWKRATLLKPKVDEEVNIYHIILVANCRWGRLITAGDQSLRAIGHWG